MKKLLIIIALLIFTLPVCSAQRTIKNDSIVLAFMDEVKYVLDSIGVEEPVYVLAQAAYESGWFNCKKCSWKYNNMFGFTSQSGEYLRFKTWQDCLVYYSNWQKKRYPKYKISHPKGNYLGFLKYCHFSESAEYGRHIQNTYDWILDYWAEED